MFLIDTDSSENRLIIGTIVTSIVVLFLVLFPSESQVLQVIRTLFGSVFLLFLPGYRLTRIFFTEKELDLLERIALSFALSISVVPLLVFYANLAGVPISALMVWIISVLVIAISMLYFLYSKNHTLIGKK